MSMPYYVSPEQLMKDRADYARKGISRGRSVVVVQYADGVLFVSENPSQALHKVSEIYDRIAFAGVGKFSEFDNLRKIGVRYADMKGYSYSRDDVRAKALANAYSQAMGEAFMAVMGFTAQNGIQPLTMPTSLYLEMPNSDVMTFRGGVFVSAEDAAKARPGPDEIGPVFVGVIKKDRSKG